MFSLTNYVNSHRDSFHFHNFLHYSVYCFTAGTSLIFLHHPHCLLHNMTLTEYFWNDEMNKLTNKCIHVHKYLPWLNTSTISIFSFPFYYWYPPSLGWVRVFSDGFHFSVFLAANVDHMTKFEPLLSDQKDVLIFPNWGQTTWVSTLFLWTGPLTWLWVISKHAEGDKNSERWQEH